MIFCGDMTAIVVEGHEFAQQPVIISQSVRETGGSRVEQDQIGIQGAGIDENDRRKIINDFF
jgi:hypothetical protein